MDNMNNVIGEVGFRFSSRFSQLIGRNLISNPIVAVSELVKNSYDADADNISVEFSNLLSGVPTLKITDDGDGMTFDDIATKWMMVGTDNKVHNPLTPKGRRKLGEKGIGRFSVERLARKLQIISSKSDDDFAISLSIDWDQYENYDGEFSALTHRVVKLPCDICHKGTTLILSDLRDEWTETRLLDLQKEIELLRPLDINRLSFKKYSFPGDNVKIALSAPGILKKKTFINSNFIDYAQAHLYGEIKEDGSAVVKVFIKSNISASKSDIKAEYTYSPSDIDTCCGPISCEVFAYNYYKKQNDFRSRETQIYRNIATLGISAAMFGHEALNQTVDAKAIVNDIFADFSAILEAADSWLDDLLKKRERAVNRLNELEMQKQDFLSKEAPCNESTTDLHTGMLKTMYEMVTTLAEQTVLMIDEEIHKLNILMEKHSGSDEE